MIPGKRKKDVHILSTFMFVLIAHIFPFSSYRLFSTADKADQSEAAYALDLTHYGTQRDFNLKLEDIAIECSSKKKKNIDVISRATFAEALVTKLDLAREAGTAPFEVDIITYNTLMKVWAKAAQTLAEGRGRGDVNSVIHAMDDVPEELMNDGVYTAGDAALRALEILNGVEQRYLTGESNVAPNTFSYNIVLDGLHKGDSRDSVEDVEELFNKMKKWSAEGVADPYDEEEYVNSDASKWKQIRPDAITYSIVMETLGQSKDYGVMSKIENLLEEIETEYERTKDEELKPVTRVSNAAINAILKNSTGPRNSKTKSNKAWLSAKKVHEIINSCNKKWKETGDESYRPDITTITMAIDAYSRCYDLPATERGEFLFEKAYKDWKATGDKKLKPSSKSFTVVSAKTY